jgi:hypothetical protein
MNSVMTYVINCSAELAGDGGSEIDVGLVGLESAACGRRPVVQRLVEPTSERLSETRTSHQHRNKE